MGCSFPWCGYWVEYFLPTGTTVSDRGSWDFKKSVIFSVHFYIISNIFIAKEVSSHTHSSRCPAVKGNESQWIQYREHCYASDRALRNFSEAKQFCSKLGELKFIDFLGLNNAIIGIFSKEIIWNNDYIFENILGAPGRLNQLSVRLQLGS